MRCNFWEKSTNSRKVGLGCSNPLTEGFCINFHFLILSGFQTLSSTTQADAELLPMYVNAN